MHKQWHSGAMTENSESITVSRTIDAPADKIFDVLSLPARHNEIDASGTVRSAEDTERISAVGDVFVMNMYAERMGGEYKMFNHVTGVIKNKLVSWQPAQEKSKDEPAGWEWVWEIESEGSAESKVSLTYDWRKVTDEKLKQIFPEFSEEELEESLNALAKAVA